MKELIFLEKSRLAPQGGPAGYLYNLYNELNKKGITDIEFLDGGVAQTKRKVRDLVAKSPKFIKKLYNKYSNNYGARIFENVMYGSSFTTPVNLNDYDVIHFHSTIELYMVKDSLKDYKGTVILTSHTPKISYLELIDHMNDSFKKKHKDELEAFSKFDEYAFDRADYIHFPAPEAEECYYNTWDKYSAVHERNKDKYFYIPTGINAVHAKMSRKDVRQELNIPEDAFVVCYVGRHNEVKGYDKLKEIAEATLKTNKNVYFLICGAEGPMYALNNSRWIEVGWTNHPHDYISASDVFILPNKETYFDLILLEVLSLGKPVMLTNTGGNKYFKKFEKSGLFFYDYENNQSAVKVIEELQTKDLEEASKLNKQIFEDNFTISKFTDDYLVKVKELVERK